MNWTWRQLWDFRSTLDDAKLRERLDRQIGFVVISRKLHLTTQYAKYLEHCSVPVLRARLDGAPWYLVKAYRHRMTLRQLKSLLETASET